MLVRTLLSANQAVKREPAEAAHCAQHLINKSVVRDDLAFDEMVPSQVWPCPPFLGITIEEVHIIEEGQRSYFFQFCK